MPPDFLVPGCQNFKRLDLLLDLHADRGGKPWYRRKLEHCSKSSLRPYNRLWYLWDHIKWSIYFYTAIVQMLAAIRKNEWFFDATTNRYSLMHTVNMNTARRRHFVSLMARSPGRSGDYGRGIWGEGIELHEGQLLSKSYAIGTNWSNNQIINRNAWRYPVVLNCLFLLARQYDLVTGELGARFMITIEFSERGGKTA